MEKTQQKLSDTYGGHWKQHPGYPVEDWKLEVENDDTRLGYWEWVEARLAEEAECR